MRRLAFLGALAASAIGFVGCASTAPPRVVSRIPVSEQSYVMDPLAGYPLTVDAGSKQRVRTAFFGFSEGRSLSDVAAQADALVEEDPSFLPAGVLRAQVDFLNGRDRETVERVQPILDELPDYLAASLLAARSLERMGALLKAYEVFEGLSSFNSLGAERAEQLRPRAIEIVERRFSDALSRGNAPDAREHLTRLESWSVDELRVLDLKSRLYFDTGETDLELTTIRRLMELSGTGGSDESESVELFTQLRRRLGDLELEVGDVRTGMEIFELLVAEHTEDAELLDRVEHARFLWRLELLPPHVQEIARLPELDRASLASMLYWLFPSVRFSGVEDPPIATDILDHSGREEILRVLDLELMDVDETVHRFNPQGGATRRVALSALLTLLQTAEEPDRCMEGELSLSLHQRSRRWVCENATQCGLLSEPTECLPAAILSGGEAVDLIRRCLDRLGSP